jgi:DNA-binding NtrC family response regulator
LFSPVESTMNVSGEVLVAPTVLVVDDDPQVRGLFADYLRARGVSVVEASNGLEGLIRFKRVHPQAVVLDVLMPRLGGLQALERMRSAAPTVNVVVVTASTDPALRRQAETYGVTAVLTKPINLQDLWEALGGDEAMAGPPGDQWRGPDTSPPVTETLPAAGRIVVVGDDPQFRALLEQCLAGEGYHVRSVEDGADALKLMADEPPDVVVIDVDLPSPGSLTFLTAIDRVAPDVKVILLGGANGFELVAESFAHGAFEFLPKLSHFRCLVQTVQAAVLMKQLDTEWRADRAACGRVPEAPATDPLGTRS